jgi:hypothetical protein
MPQSEGKCSISCIQTGTEEKDGNDTSNPCCPESTRGLTIAFTTLVNAATAANIVLNRINLIRYLYLAPFGWVSRKSRSSVLC